MSSYVLSLRREGFPEEGDKGVAFVFVHVSGAEKVVGMR